MDIVGDLMQQVATGDTLSAISRSVGGDSASVKSALGMGLPLVLGSMANSATKPGGADMLTSMLTKAGSSSPLDNLGGFLASPASAGGSGMVNSLFGSQMAPIQSAIAQKTGLPEAAVSKVMEIAAPMVMGYIGKMFVAQKMDAAGLTGLLADQSKTALKSSPDAAGIAQQFLASQVDSGGLTGALKKFFR